MSSPAGASGPAVPGPPPRHAAAIVLLAGAAVGGCGDAITDPADCTVGGGLQLAVGELGVRSADADGCLAFTLPDGDGSASYVLAAQEASRGPGTTPLRLAVEGGSGAAAARSVPAAPAIGPRLDASAARRQLRSGERADRIRENARRTLVRRGVRPARRTRTDAPGVRRSLLPAGDVPREGDTLSVRLAVNPDLSISCDVDSAEIVAAEVMESANHEVAILADTALSDAAVREMDWASLAEEYDNSVLSVPEAYFGQATDIDGNERVLVLFTPEVNQLTDRGSDVRIGGFFIPADLADSGDGGRGADAVCETSNEAEIIYLLAPDPDGEFSDAVSVEDARRNGIGVSPGEFEHLINTGNRVIRESGSFGDLETAWLDEGLSHLSEEVVGLERAGLPVRDNIDLEQAAADSSRVAVFNTFHIQNFLRARRYLADPSGTRALAAEDPRNTESLKMRGFSYLFLRWLGDQEGPDGSGAVDGSREQELFRELARGSGQLATGIDNVEAATGREWSDLIRDFTAVPPADDTVDTAPRLQLLTWDLPTTYRQLHENFEQQGVSDNPFPEIYPLELSALGSPSDTAVDLEVQGSAARYFRVDADGGALTVRLTGPNGTLLDDRGSSRLLVLRVN